MNNKRTFYLLIPFFVIVFLIAIIAIVKVTAQNQNTQDLAFRLEQLGIPVLDIKTTSQQPYQIEITLQSQSEDGKTNVDDIWNLVMTRRQANLASRIGLHLDRYSIHLIYKNGKTILKDTAYIYATDIDQTTTGKEVKLSHEDSIRAVNQELDYGSLKVELLEIFVNQEINGGGQTLILELSGKDMASISKDLPDFLHSLFRLFETEQSLGLGLAICHLRVVDESGTILLDFVRDLESGISQWTMQPGVYDEWFPKPEPAPTATSEISLPGYPAQTQNTSSDNSETTYPSP